MSPYWVKEWSRKRKHRLGSLTTIIAGRQLTSADRFGILLGEGVAHATKLKPGDRATLLLNTAEGALNSLDFDVVGVFRTFSKEYDARAVRVSLRGRAGVAGSAIGQLPLCWR